MLDPLSDLSESVGLSPDTLGIYRNVPIPGTYFADDFADRVHLLGKVLTIRSNNPVRHKRWTNYIKPFINSAKWFKFLVDLTWINYEYNKGPLRVSQNAKDIFQQLSAIKYIPGGHT